MHRIDSLSSIWYDDRLIAREVCLWMLLLLLLFGNNGSKTQLCSPVVRITKGKQSFLLWTIFLSIVTFCCYCCLLFVVVTRMLKRSHNDDLIGNCIVTEQLLQCLVHAWPSPVSGTRTEQSEEMDHSSRQARSTCMAWTACWWQVGGLEENRSNRWRGPDMIT